MENKVSEFTSDIAQNILNNLETTDYSKIETATLKDMYDTISQEFKENIIEKSYRDMGAGSYFRQYVHNFSKIDRYNIKHMLPNTEYSGLTFITRPKLNLSSPTLRSNRFLNTLETLDPYSSQFMVRSLLDTYSSKWNSNWRKAINQSPLLDFRSPFLTPLTNNLISISGFPSHTVETFTSEGGYFGEDYSLVVGSDDHKKSFDLQLTFTEPQGGVLNYLFHIWLVVMALQCTGDILPYSTDINRRILNYTVSIYRFLLDPTRRFITKASKCTGCFPISRPSGAAFDFNISDRYVAAARDLSITFKANHFMEDDPIIYKCFNTLVSRYWPDIEAAANTPGLEDPDNASAKGLKKAANTPENNYMGIPYVITNKSSRNPPELAFFYTDRIDKLFNDSTKVSSQAKDLGLLKREIQNRTDISSTGNRIYI